MNLSTAAALTAALVFALGVGPCRSERWINSETQSSQAACGLRSTLQWQSVTMAMVSTHFHDAHYGARF